MQNEAAELGMDQTDSALSILRIKITFKVWVAVQALSIMFRICDWSFEKIWANESNINDTKAVKRL